MKPFIYEAEFLLIEQNYISPKSSHSRGSTVDLTLITTHGDFVDMGGSFDLFHERSNSDYTNLTSEQLKNRRILRDAMQCADFEGIDSEWWHFTYKFEPFPNTYFDFDVE